MEDEYIEIDDKEAEELINVLNSIDYIKTKFCCIGHGEGHKTFYIDFIIPDNEKDFTKMFKLLYKIITKDKRLSLKTTSPKFSLRLYSEYVRYSTALSIIESLTNLVKKEVK